MNVKRTNKSLIIEFDGYSDYYGALVQGAPVGKWIVPRQHWRKLRWMRRYQSDWQALEELREEGKAKRCGYRRIQ